MPHLRGSHRDGFYSILTNETDPVAGFAIGSPKAVPTIKPASDQFMPPVHCLHSFL